MSNDDRKAAIAAYKERKVAAGIYLVRCLALDARWAGQATDLSTIWNRLTFELRHHTCRNRSLQAAWRAHESETWTFEVVEQLDEETLPYLRHRLLSERLAYWCPRLSADPIE